MSRSSLKAMGLKGQLNLGLLVLLAFTLLLSLWCVYKVWATPLPGPIMPPEDALSPLAIEPRVVVQDVDIIALRPLFWASRVAYQAAPAKPEARAPARDEIDKLKVVGVYSSGVLVKGLKGKGRVAIGDEILGWRLDKVDASEVTFSRHGQSKTLQLESAKPRTLKKARARPVDGWR
ncbi:MAG: hypothetical protein OIF35_11005 [Cellvibrionaceae bacterium]|nr:hypothetical protein [Cellvibrionaceae bacterium]MCV6627081.1 hypothetical protein [Cellvibrionaceae bacterium]